MTIPHIFNFSVICYVLATIQLPHDRLITDTTATAWGHMVAQLVEALHYKSEGHAFDSRWCHWIFPLT